MISQDAPLTGQSTAHYFIFFGTNPIHTHTQNRALINLVMVVYIFYTRRKMNTFRLDMMELNQNGKNNQHCW